MGKHSEQIEKPLLTFGDESSIQVQDGEDGEAFENERPSEHHENLENMLSSTTHKSKKHEVPRIFHVGEGAGGNKFCNNGVSTTRYIFSPFKVHKKGWKIFGKNLPWIQFFFPIQNLLEQFRRVANIYFLLIASLQLFTPLSPTGRESTIIPLTIVVIFSMIKDGIEDWKRRWGDIQVNHQRKVLVLEKGRMEKKKWKDVKVGQIVKISNKEKFPCDLIVISTSEPQGLCYIETSSLDGETNLKIRRATDETQHLKTIAQLERFNATITCEKPNKALYCFEGAMTIGGEDGNKIPLEPDQILLRGSSLRNTGWVYAIAVFTGHDTKLMNNQNQAPHKVSKVEKQTNKFIFSILATLVTLCIACTIGSMIVTGGKLTNEWYIAEYQEGPPGLGKILEQGGTSFITFLILFNNLIPISLYVSVEIAKFIQGLFMGTDMRMYYEPGDVSCVTRNSSLNEELGQIDYIFSDKTGTLTCNKMELLKFITSGIAYGTGHTEIEQSNARRKGKILKNDRPPGFEPDADGFKFYDERISNGNWYKQPNREAISEFFTLLAVCHTVIPETTPNGTIAYQAASPDEAALVKAAAKVGFEFIDRTTSHVTIRIRGKEYRYECLNILEFTSKRKRMSVIVRDEKNQIILLTKGADNVLLPLLTPEERNGLGNTLALLESAADAGLRTLVCGKAILKEEAYQAWNKKFQDAKCAYTGREAKLEAVNDEIEKNLSYVGITAIEDELQEGVPKTIAELAEAGIKIWVLTGDKQATAINIGFACDLLNNDMVVYVIEGSTPSEIYGELKNHLEDVTRFEDDPSAQVGLVIEGNRLKLVLADDGLKKLFLKLGCKCRSVICCRVSPSQKADVVSLVRKYKKKVTLSIGDGANDVPMIQAAHVGIGISGEEGLQACNASDYSFGQFRYLRNLLLVHGRWNYRRIAKLILYSFYKNTVLYLTQMWYVFFNNFSGASVHDRWTVSTYNILFTSLPIMALACFDRDVKNVDTILQFPRLYRQGHKNTFFSMSIFISWLANSIYHSLVCFLIPYLWASQAIWTTGMLNDKWSLGIVIYSAVLITVTLKCAFETSSFTMIHLICLVVSVLIWFLFVFCYSSILFIFPSSWLASFPFSLITSFMEEFRVLLQPEFYLVVLLTVFVALFRDFVYKALKRNLSQRLYYKVQRYGDQDRAEDIKSASREDTSLIYKQMQEEWKALKSIFSRDVLKYRGYAFSQTHGQEDHIAVRFGQHD